MQAWTGFSGEEWNLVVRLPRWVAAAASAAQADLAYRQTIEKEAGFIAAADGRELGNAFVTAVAQQTMAIYDARTTVEAINFDDRDAGIAQVLDLVRGVNELLKERVAPVDAMAYRKWLLNVTDVVISSARTGGFLGIGGVMVTANERGFRDRLIVVIQS